MERQEWKMPHTFCCLFSSYSGKELSVSLVLQQKQVLLRICKPPWVSKAVFFPSLFTQGLVCPFLCLLQSMLLQTALLLKECLCVLNTILYNWADLAPRNYYNFIKQKNLQIRLSSVKGKFSKESERRVERLRNNARIDTKLIYISVADWIRSTIDANALKECMGTSLETRERRDKTIGAVSKWISTLIYVLFIIARRSHQK